MIDESQDWKDPLLRAARWIQRLRISEESADKSYVRLEKEVFIGFYAVRKLLDTFKISKSTKCMTFRLQWYKCIKKVDYLNCHRIAELYDLENSGSEQRDLTFLCNQFIHSYIYLPLQDEEGRVEGFLVTSDRTRNKKLYFVDVKQVTLTFKAVGEDYPHTFRFVRNPETGDIEDATDLASNDMSLMFNSLDSVIK